MIFLVALVATVVVVSYVAWRDRNISPMRLPELLAVCVVTFFCFTGVIVAFWRCGE
jgi:hypothetical protein